MYDWYERFFIKYGKLNRQIDINEINDKNFTKMIKDKSRQNKVRTSHEKKSHNKKSQSER